MPQLELRGGCHRVFAVFDASIEDVAEGGLWYSRMNVRNCRRNPKLHAELFRRGDAALRGYAAGTFGALPGTGVERPVPGGGGRVRWVPPVAPIVYEDEPHDKWRDLSSIAETANGQTWRLDCDCGSPVWAAWFHLRGLRAGIGVSQPNLRKDCTPGVGGAVCGYGMAHEYTIVDLTDVWPWPALANLPGVHLGGEVARRVGLPSPRSNPDAVGVFDGSVLGAMGVYQATGPNLNGPPASFYGSGESAHIWLPEDF